MKVETALAALDGDALQGLDRPGTPSGYSCPDCNGTLYEITEAGVVRYRCRVGHAWSAHSLMVEQSQALESALWMALRSLEEKASLACRLADQAESWGNPLSAGRFREQSGEEVQAAGLIRSLLERGLLPDDERAG
jgi:two-component system, chemotaxis family, protein-glutamate methylesterase/glutaminase